MENLPSVSVGERSESSGAGNETPLVGEEVEGDFVETDFGEAGVAGCGLGDASGGGLACVEGLGDVGVFVDPGVVAVIASAGVEGRGTEAAGISDGSDAVVAEASAGERGIVLSSGEGRD